MKINTSTILTRSSLLNIAHFSTIDDSNIFHIFEGEMITYHSSIEPEIIPEKLLDTIKNNHSDHCTIVDSFLYP